MLHFVRLKSMPPNLIFKTQIYIPYVYTKILEVNLFAFAYRLFRRDFSLLNALPTDCFVEISLYSTALSREKISTKQSVGKCKQINF